MGLFDLFRKKKKRTTKHRRPKSGTNRRKYIASFAEDITRIQSELEVIQILLCRHDQDIGEHSYLLKKHRQRLEQLVDQSPTSQTLGGINPANRPISTTDPVSPSQKLDISRFSPQEKRILSVFFQNQDMALSYADIAQYLSKSPNTIKSQVRQINMKADLLNYTVDNESRKRYKLKDGLKIEKYLNINRPDGSPNRLN